MIMPPDPLPLDPTPPPQGSRYRVRAADLVIGKRLSSEYQINKTYMIAVPHEHIDVHDKLLTCRIEVFSNEIGNRILPHAHTWTLRTSILLNILRNPSPGDQSGSAVLEYVPRGISPAPRVSVLTCVSNTYRRRIRYAIRRDCSICIAFCTALCHVFGL